jgi:hypothetical protein
MSKCQYNEQKMMELNHKKLKKDLKKLAKMTGTKSKITYHYDLSSQNPQAIYVSVSNSV